MAKECRTTSQNAATVFKKRQAFSCYDSFMTVILRKATRADIAAIEGLIARSARGLSSDDYRPRQIEGALRGAFGVDTQLLTDETYWLAEEDGLVGCGGWSFRATLFGGDARAGRDATALDPKTQAAKIRAFFVDPAHARRGIASSLLERCERDARAHGFARTELMATLPGVKFYSQRGYHGGELVYYDVGAGERIEFIPMRKDL
jgi:GNAT superfamily N-acetyltransferase